VIGVIAKAGQRRVVEEFFELFKTPWEHYEEGRRYDVVLSSTGAMPSAVGTSTRLLVLFGSEQQASDVRFGIGQQHRGGIVRHGRIALPIYRGLRTFAEGRSATPLLASDRGLAGVRLGSDGLVVLRIGYDLFDEALELLTTGQPVEHAQIPTLDQHIDLLRSWMLAAGVEFVEIPPVPAGYSFVACLTHDIDFVGIRRHVFDHTMWGFVYRATVGSLRNALRGRLTSKRLMLSWRAVALLPFVYLGWVKDFWEPFEWYSDVERGLPATYFLIPFKRRAGEKVAAAHAARREARYDAAEISDTVAALIQQGCEVGVHGIDAWHDPVKGRDELDAISRVARRSATGIRMHWLLSDAQTAAALEKAGYQYDSTSGYNDTVGYRNGTGQVFRPLTAQTLLELPLHIQDGALFYGKRLDLSESEAQGRCEPVLAHARKCGGVVTVLWHDRSHGPERFWGDFYVDLIKHLNAAGAWFGCAEDVVAWFRRRRAVRFERTETGSEIRMAVDPCAQPDRGPSLTLRQYRGRPAPIGNEPTVEFVDVAWNGTSRRVAGVPVPHELV
jgi:hypothetical protein